MTDPPSNELEAPTEPRATDGGAARVAPSSGPSHPNVYALAMGAFRWVALGVVLVTVLARGLAPAFHGFAVGYDRLTDRVEFVAEVATQLGTFVLVSLVVGLVVEVARSRAPIALRIVAIILTALGLLMVASSVGSDRAALLLLLVTCVAASSLAILCGVDAARQPAAGWLGAAPIVAGVASSLRGVAVLVADRAALLPRTEGVEGARVLATIAFGLHAVVIAIALVWLTTRRRIELWVGAGLVVVLSALAAWAFTGERGSAGHLFLLLKLGVGNLLSLPVPLVPVSAEVGLTVASVLVALLAVTARKQVPALVASLGLVCLVGPSAEVPVYALALLAGSLGFTLASRDARGVWAAIQSRGTAPAKPASKARIPE